MDYVKIPVMIVKPNCLVFYDKPLSHGRRKSIFGSLFKQAPTNNEKYTGYMTDSAVYRLRYIINLLVAQAKWKTVRNPWTGKEYKFKINFTTLTLSGPQLNVGDKEIKEKMLKPWIRAMRHRCGLRSYIWRAERQKNGRLHFHITADTYMDLNIIRDEWNRIQSNYHFIDYFRENNDSIWPNSTDVHSVKDVRNIAAYLVKYMSKQAEDEQKIDGRLWDCSTNLKTREKVSYEMGSDEWSLLEKLKLKYNCLPIDGNYAAVMPIPDHEFKNALKGKWYTDYSNFLERVYRAADMNVVRNEVRK